MGDLSKFLKQAQSKWGETVEKAKSSSFENHPDGSYIAQLSSADVGESKAGNQQVKWGFTILEGELAGKTHIDFMGLEGKLGLDPLAWRLQSLGYKLEDVDLTKLEELLDEIVKRNIVMKISLKTNGDFQNMRVQKLLPNYNDEDNTEYASSEPAVKGEAEAEAAADEAVDLAVGMKVSFDVDGENLEGVVKAIRDPDNEADIRVGLKAYKVPLDNIVDIIEEGTDG